MNIKQAEAVAFAPAQHTRDERRRAFAWADRKQHDARVTPAYRARAAAVGRALWHWAGQQQR